MCGLTAFQTRGPLTSWSAAERARLASAAQAHRGPDGEGLWWSATDPHTGSQSALAHRRLAVIDLSPAGHQPMADPETGHVLVFNGEIYNHRELRHELGGEWTGTSDTETLLRAYAQWGEACLHRLRGMFAFVLWDARRRVLWAARDRFGIKPLYLVEAADGAALASEVRALVASGMVVPRLSRVGLAGYVRFGCVPEPTTLLEGVRAVPPGHALTLREGRVERVERWWDLRREVVQAGAPPVLEHVLENAVEEHLESDVPLAWLLSGGIDSGLLMALAARGRGRGMQAFTLAWDDPRMDERDGAAAIAAHVGCAHEVVALREEQAIEGAKACVAACDQPSVDGVNTWLVAQAIHAQGFKVALSGLGGDELFAGYPSFRWAPRAQRWSGRLGGLPRWVLALAVGPSRVERARDLLKPGLGLSQRVEVVRALWASGDLRAALGGALGDVPPLAVPDEGREAFSPLAEVSALELGGYMRSMLLRDTDAIGMAHALELRVPFLDHRVVVAALQAARSAQPASWLDKQVLRRLATGLLPEQVRMASKRGFVVPMDRWVAGPLQAFTNEGLGLLADARVLQEGFLRSVREQAQAGTLHWSRPWSLAVLGHWLARHGVATQGAQGSQGVAA